MTLKPKQKEENSDWNIAKQKKRIEQKLRNNRTTIPKFLIIVVVLILILIAIYVVNCGKRKKRETINRTNELCCFLFFFISNFFDVVFVLFQMMMTTTTKMTKNVTRKRNNEFKISIQQLTINHINKHDTREKEKKKMNRKIQSKQSNECNAETENQ